ARDRHPLPELPRLVDAHADHEHDEIAVDLRRHALRMNFGHGYLPSSFTRELLSRITQTQAPTPVTLRSSKTSSAPKSNCIMTYHVAQGNLIPPAGTPSVITVMVFALASAAPSCLGKYFLPQSSTRARVAPTGTSVSTIAAQSARNFSNRSLAAWSSRAAQMP